MLQSIKGTLLAEISEMPSSYITILTLNYNIIHNNKVHCSTMQYKAKALYSKEIISTKQQNIIQYASLSTLVVASTGKDESAAGLLARSTTLLGSPTGCST